MIKNFLALGVKNIDFFIALIFDIYAKFLDLSFSNKFTIVLLALLSPSLSTILLSLALNIFMAKSNNLIVFNKEVSSKAILLKPYIKRK